MVRYQDEKNRSVCTPLTSTRLSASEVIAVRRPQLFLASRGLVQASSTLHILHTTRLLGQSNDSQRQPLQPAAGISSNVLHSGLSLDSVWRVRLGIFVDPELEQQPSVLHEASQLYFLRTDTTRS